MTRLFWQPTLQRQRQLAQRAATLALAAIITLAVPAISRANELIVMPYRCSMASGQPLLTPSDQQGHQILGRREERKITICAPSDPNRCRTWNAYRFNVDCDGVDVPWAAFVAGSPQARDGRAWMEGPSLQLRMPPAWSLDRDDPCAEPYDANGRRLLRRFDRACDDRPRRPRDAYVEMPPGFAPMLGLDGVFVPDDARIGGANTRPGPPPVAWKASPQPPVQPPLAVAPPPSPAAPEQSLPRKKPVIADQGSRPAPVTSAAPQTPVDAAREPLKEARIAVPSTAPSPGQPNQPPGASRPLPQPSAASPGALPPVASRPEILNRQASPPEPGSPAAPTLATPPIDSQNATAALATSTAQLAQNSALAQSTALAQADRETNAVAANPMSSRPAKIPSPGLDPRLISILIAATLAISMVGAYFWRRRPATPIAPPIEPRDFASVSLQIAPALGASPTASWHDAPFDQVPPHPNTNEPLEPNGQLAASPGVQLTHAPVPPTHAPAVAETQPQWPVHVPRTPDDALHILGMGVSPDANLAAIKKIVDGLRLSWHPDLATDDADRAVRELRIRQINAAWDILSSRR